MTICRVCGKDPCERLIFYNKQLDLYRVACEIGAVICPQCDSEGYVNPFHKPCPLCDSSGEVTPLVNGRYRLKQSYKPEKIKVLFVGESPPQKDQYFYDANSNLFRCIQKAFQDSVDPDCGGGIKFLEYFKKAGCFLDDLCSLPVNGMTTPEENRKRNQLQDEGISYLREKIALMHPAAVIIIMKRIKEKVKTACDKVVPKPQIDCIPFPSNGWQTKSCSELSGILKFYKANGIV